MTDFLRAASLYRPGTDQYREVYELAAYTYPSCAVVQLNAAAAALSQGDKESARYFFNQAGGDQRAFNNLGVLALWKAIRKQQLFIFVNMLYRILV